MPVDNELYNRLSDTWWDDTQPLGLLRTLLGPVRFGYFRRVLLENLKKDASGLRVLDVGCGGGSLAEDFARLGCNVTGIDPSEHSLNTARKHAAQSSLKIQYEIGLGESIPFADASFDVVVCCDVLEHVDDVVAVIQDISRVLTRGGILFYETINATFLSWLGAIKLAQDWRLTRFLPPNLHDWSHFIHPRELARMLQQYHLRNQQVRGMSPGGNPFVFLGRFFRYKLGQIDLAEMTRCIRLHESAKVSILYMGYAMKT